MEWFHGTLKREYSWSHDFSNYQEAEAVISEAFLNYNCSKMHSALKYVPPDEFLASWEAKHKWGAKVCKIMRKAVYFSGVHSKYGPKN